MKDNASPARLPTAALLTLALFAASACTGSAVTTGIVDGRLAPCPASPNCVCSDTSDATDKEHFVKPYRLKAAPAQAWHGLQNVVAAQERVTVVSVDDTYLHAEFRSALFRFVDDTEFQLRASEGIIAVRSASRIGYGDMGVNRKRIETIRQAMRARQLIE